MHFLRKWIFQNHFRTVSDSCFSITFISGSENLNHMIIFLSYFHVRQAFFKALRSSFFEIFRKLQQRNSVMGSIFYYAVELRRFWGILRNSQNKESVEVLWTTTSELLNIFSLNVSIFHFLDLLLTCPLKKKFLKYSYMSILQKANFCTNFPEFREFWSI